MQYVKRLHLPTAQSACLCVPPRVSFYSSQLEVSNTSPSPGLRALRSEHPPRCHHSCKAPHPTPHLSEPLPSPPESEPLCFPPHITAARCHAARAPWLCFTASSARVMPPRRSPKQQIISLVYRLFKKGGARGQSTG